MKSFRAMECTTGPSRPSKKTFRTFTKGFITSHFNHQNSTLSTHLSFITYFTIKCNVNINVIELIMFYEQSAEKLYKLYD